MGEVIVITSGKGGVGKTTTTANIGAGLSKFDKKVVVIDTDLGLRNLDVVMGLENLIVYNLVDVIEGTCRLKQALIRDKRYENLYLLPSAQTKDKTAISPGPVSYTHLYVVNASSEPGRLAVNGMSYHDRDGFNANSAVIVTVTPQDYGGTGVLAGMEFQRRLEEAAYRLGKGRIPVQLFEDFCKNRPSKGPGDILPQMKGAYAWSNVREIFPPELSRALEEGIRSFDRKIKGYPRPDALVSGVESRTSSPVRISRDEDVYKRQRIRTLPCSINILLWYCTSRLMASMWM